MHKPMIGIGLAAMAAAMVSSASAPAYAAVRKTAVAAPSNSDEWALINLTPDLVASANGGSGVLVALLDGLTDCRHPDLSGRCENVMIQGGRYRFYDSHGTHTAGIVAGKKYGVAPSARIVNYAVFDDRGYVATGSKLLNAWYAAGAKGATIASMSFGCAQLALCFTAAEVQAMADPNLKMLFVKAAGNDGVNLLSEPIGVTASQASAAMARLILVGSVKLGGTISSFSNRPGDGCLLYSGASACTSATQWKNHFIVAPGENIYSTLPGGGYGYMSGTSMATPIVAGVAALLEARWPTLKSSPENVAQILFTSATDLGAPGVDPVYGWGLLNVGRAFQASGTVTLLGSSGPSQTMTGTMMTAGATMGPLAAALGRVTVYDEFGRDFALAQTGALRVRRDYDSDLRLAGRRLIGLGGQADWAASFFADRHAPRGFAMFNSPAEPTPYAFTPDRSLRMGIDMPFKGGVAQLRLTGASAARLDFAYDPSLRPLSFFASTGLLKNALFAHALFDVSSHGRLSLYGTSTTGSVSAASPDEPSFLHDMSRNSITRVALSGTRAEERRQGVGIGYWLQPDRDTVIGFNASMLTQKGGYYDVASNLAAFQKPTRLINLGAAASRTFGRWEASASGELTALHTAASLGPIAVTPAKLVSGELRLRRDGIGFSRGVLKDNLSLALVLPPRPISGNLEVDYLTRTADGLGREAASYRAPLSDIGTEPLKVEAAYQLGRAGSWSFDISGGLNMRHSAYSGAGEALTSFHLAL
ncbi:MAG TPA: S8 family peptidase [Allosphingosinicella sp.]|nr:S8 family peptidase [Allosphingosinicella sp.]